LTNFDKHSWICALIAHDKPRFTALELRAGIFICERRTWTQGKGWKFEIKHLAEVLDASERKVSSILDKLRDAGFLLETYRSVTGPGSHASRTYNLLERKPPQDWGKNTVTEQCGRSDETLSPNSAGVPEHCHQTEQTLSPNGANTVTERRSQTASDQGINPVQGSYKGIKQGIRCFRHDWRGEEPCPECGPDPWGQQKRSQEEEEQLTW
jgi:hypothetical protein